jgi:DNA uptake protein ComE-like DNA-binding protein
MKAAGDKLSKGAASGLVALVFLVLGFQLALFVVKVVERPAVQESVPEPDSMRSPVNPRSEPRVTEKSAGASEAAGGVRRSDLFSGARRTTERRNEQNYESFVFDPNTITLADLQRLGLSERQAASIENYRAKGGRFRSKADFQKMYVVSDTLFARLEPFIDIPKLELNTVDSAALLSLRGIGPWYAHKILTYRERLGGFVDVAQLREIDGLDDERLSGFIDQVCVDSSRIRRLDLWHASDTLLAAHPYLGPKGARSLLRYRSLYDSTRWTLSDLAREHALPVENIEKLKKYIEIQ